MKFYINLEGSDFQDYGHFLQFVHTLNQNPMQVHVVATKYSDEPHDYYGVTLVLSTYEEPTPPDAIDIIKVKELNELRALRHTPSSDTTMASAYATIEVPF